MGTRREILAFCAVLAVCVGLFFHETLFGGKVLSSADVLLVSASFREAGGPDYEPANRLLMDPVLQFQPWLEFNRRMVRSGRLPLWNGHAGCGAPHLANGQSAVFDPFHLLAYLGSTAGGICLDRSLPAVGGWAGDVPAGQGLGTRLLGTLVCRPGLSILRVPGRLAFVPGHCGGDLDALVVAGDRSRVSASGAAVGWLAGGCRGVRDPGRTYPDELRMCCLRRASTP